MPVAQADSRSVWRSRREVSDGQGKKEREMDVMQAGNAQQPQDESSRDRNGRIFPVPVTDLLLHHDPIKVISFSQEMRQILNDESASALFDRTTTIFRLDFASLLSLCLCRLMSADDH